MLVEGYLSCFEALWMWDDATQERMVGVQEYWLEHGYLLKRRPIESLYYGVIFTNWPEVGAYRC